MTFDQAIDRRAFLKLGGVSALAAAFPSILLSKTEEYEKTLSFYNIHTGESLRTTFWAEGSYIPEALEDINKILRDHRTGTEAAMDSELLDLLHAVRTKLDSKEAFHIISGYRSPKTNAMLHNNTSGVAKKSLHMQGKAIDINLPRTELSMLRKAAVSEKIGGVGYYPESHFVHVDTGRVRYW
ncbi:DUF882 domain-containing protein [Sulfurimonas sp. HSL1-2]|uniref:DUF882 domain-containing protein n=1 Tax=Thiomicrolovo zhangzhouensis TaxID=3131933 RepID=UPI0031FA37AB